MRFITYIYRVLKNKIVQYWGGDTIKWTTDPKDVKEYEDEKTAERISLLNGGTTKRKYLTLLFLLILPFLLMSQDAQKNLFKIFDGPGSDTSFVHADIMINDSGFMISVKAVQVLDYKYSHPESGNYFEAKVKYYVSMGDMPSVPDIGDQQVDAERIHLVEHSMSDKWVAHSFCWYIDSRNVVNLRPWKY